jgi:hypothetical protein
MNRYPYIILILALLIGALFFLIIPAAAGQTGDWPALYTTDFSDNEGWTTNSNDRFNLDGDSGRYHYIIEGGTGGYSVVMLPQKIIGSCSLEFDITPSSTDNGGTHRFGIGTEKKDSLKGPLLMAELANKKDGRLFYLKTISKGNALNSVGSSPSTGSSGLTVRYEDNTTYHIRITYYAEEKRASMTVSRAGSPGVLASLISQTSGSMEGLTHLFITSLGDGVTGPKAEGYIDNITVTVPALQPTATPTPQTEDTGLPTEIPTLAVSSIGDADNTSSNVTVEPGNTGEAEAKQGAESLPLKPEPSRTPFPLPPTQQPEPIPTQKSGGAPLLVIPAIALAGAILGRRG